MDGRGAGDGGDEGEAPPSIAGPLEPDRQPLGSAAGRAEVVAVAADNDADADAPAESESESESAGAARPDTTLRAKPYRTEYVHGFREALRLLEDNENRRRAFDHLHVGAPLRDDEDDAQAFPRFVARLALLGRQREDCGGGGGGTAFHKISFTLDWRGLPDDDIKLLFGNVLPTHPTLQGVGLNVRRLPARYLKLFAQALPVDRGHGSVTRLEILGPMVGQAIEPDKFQAIADMMHRNAAITDLRVEPQLDAVQGRLLCHSLSRNTNLRSLLLPVEQVLADTLDGVASSSLQHLYVSGRFSEGAVASLPRQMRTNDALRYLTLTHHGDDVGGLDGQALWDLAKTYHYTLHGISGNLALYHPHARVREQVYASMWRNVRIRAAFQGLQGPDDGRRPGEVPTHLLPTLLGVVSDHPTALYRVLRLGYVNTVGERLAERVGCRDDRQHDRRSVIAAVAVAVVAFLVAAFMNRG